jgi:hypothetical protein
MMMLFAVVPTLLLTGCSEEPDNKPPGENFSQAHTVRITAPEQGERIETDFVIEFEVGANVHSFELAINDAPLTLTAADAESGSVAVTVEEGRHLIEMTGFDAQGAEISDYSITVNASGGGTWVTITSPIDGDVVYNPVTFAVDADPTLDSLEILADDWSIGTFQPGELFTYSFTGVGYDRDIVVNGYRSGEVVATDTINVTVDPGTEPIESEFTELMVDILESYPTDGSYGYWWPDDNYGWYGTTQDIYYLDELIAEGDPDNQSYCVGLTWEVFMRAFQEADAMTGGDGSLNGISVSELDEFRIDWFIRDLWGDGNVDALENYGIGERVTSLEDAQSGDVVQFWRNSGSGHNTIFIEWVRDSSQEITGLTYWSTQGSTDGIGYNTEYIGSGSSDINPSYIFLARPYMPGDWIPW